MGYEYRDGEFKGAFYIGNATHIRVRGNTEDGYDVYADKQAPLYPSRHYPTLKEALDYLLGLEVPSPEERNATVLKARGALRDHGVEA